MPRQGGRTACSPPDMPASGPSGMSRSAAELLGAMPLAADTAGTTGLGRCTWEEGRGAGATALATGSGQHARGAASGGAHCVLRAPAPPRGRSAAPLPRAAASTHHLLGLLGARARAICERLPHGGQAAARARPSRVHLQQLLAPCLQERLLHLRPTCMAGRASAGQRARCGAAQRSSSPHAVSPSGKASAASPARCPPAAPAAPAALRLAAASLSASGSCCRPRAGLLGGGACGAACTL